MTTIVLLPGMDGTGQLFAPFIRALGPECHCIVVAYPVASPLGYEELVALALASLPQDADFFIVGESFSGPIAMALAASRPRGLLGLILCCTFARKPRPQLSMLRLFTPFVSARLAPDWLLRHLLLGKYSTAQLFSTLKAAIDKVDDKVFRCRLLDITRVDVTSLLKEISVPLLYLQAKADRLVPPSAGELVQASVRNSQIAQIDGPHLLLQVASELAAQTVLQFARTVEDSLPRALNHPLPS